MDQRLPETAGGAPVDWRGQAQPEPEVVGPTFEQLYDLACEHEGEPVASMQAALARWGRPAPALAGEVGELVAWLRGANWDRKRQTLATRAADLLERQAAPVPVAPYREVADLVVWLEDHSSECLELDRPEWSRLIAKAAKFLHLYLKAAPVPVPVAVSERLPGVEDCDAEGRCWGLHPYNPEDDNVWTSWSLVSAKLLPSTPTWIGWDYWLPAHALPLPSGEVEA